MSLIESMPHVNTQTDNKQHANVLHAIYALSYSVGMELKERLDRLMKHRNINQNQLAAETKVPQPTIQRILSGESRDPRHSTLEKIAKFFNISVAELRGDVPAGYYESQPITRTTNQLLMAEEPAIYQVNREAMLKELVSQLNKQEVIQLVHMLVDTLNEKSG
ncbi:helix-turn-helix domain-containing protein [Chromobacterium haemolyticum]|uniref:helix-turn-helix domain-containing protein n=1 Tax=Chromobacterium haemolyticum TaxID=394935 RepID=UPI001746B2EE|nr:helix-turn-helix transcriptional regulator [Chromobacterium haemolyticum]QOD84161.1 helix-turn-helix transcriptional regulator [Chromobacterium haemolyticum]